VNVSAARIWAGEGIGTAFLVMAVIGSGIMAERLAGGNVALALLANSIATGGALVALILGFAPVSGAHFNPVVSLAEAIAGRVPWACVWIYVLAQVAGALSGVAATHVMFEEPLLQLSGRARAGPAQWGSEVIATFGLVWIIQVCATKRADGVAYAVAAYITAAYWFTSSTSFANPAVTIARVLTDTFTGIRPEDASGFIAAQVIGALLAAGLLRRLLPGHLKDGPGDRSPPA
jgi:glycerol uptake facilitator-like aquaporin